MRYALMLCLALTPATCSAQFSPTERIADALENANRGREQARWEDQNDKWLAAEQAKVMQMSTLAMQKEILRLRVLVDQMESDRRLVIKAVSAGDDAWIEQWLNDLNKAIRTRKKYDFEVRAAVRP